MLYFIIPRDGDIASDRADESIASDETKAPGFMGAASAHHLLDGWIDRDPVTLFILEFCPGVHVVFCIIQPESTHDARGDVVCQTEGHKKSRKAATVDVRTSEGFDIAVESIDWIAVREVLDEMCVDPSRFFFCARSDA